MCNPYRYRSLELDEIMHFVSDDAPEIHVVEFVREHNLVLPNDIGVWQKRLAKSVSEVLNTTPIDVHRYLFPSFLESLEFIQDTLSAEPEGVLCEEGVIVSTISSMRWTKRHSKGELSFISSAWLLKPDMHFLVGWKIGKN